MLLLRNSSDVRRFFAYELVSQHRPTFDRITTADLLTLGQGLNSWSAVDCFAMSLVSTVARSRRGNAGDFPQVSRICALLAEDRDDMVVKALSWALRELAKKHPGPVGAFLAEHKDLLAARVTPEVNNELSTGLKTPRSVR